MKKKRLVINKEQYNKVKEIISTMTCFRDAEIKIAKEFNIDEDNAYRLLKAVYYQYKYLEVIE